MKAIQHTQTCKHVHTHAAWSKRSGTMQMKASSIHRHANTHTRSVEQKIWDHANEGNAAYTDMQTHTHAAWSKRSGTMQMKAIQHTQTCKHTHTHTQRGAKDLGPCK